MENRGSIVLYRTKNGKTEIEVKFVDETVWLSQAHLAKLFATERSVITKHLQNIFNSNELQEKSNVQKMHIANSDKPIKFYNLDVIVSLGYRVNSKRATQFRIWATSVLRKYLIDGYVLNERRLKEQSKKLEALQKTIALIGHVKDTKKLEYNEATGLLEVISDYNYALGLLDDYDNGRLKVVGTTREGKFRIRYEDARQAIWQMKKRLGGSNIFGVEKDQSLKSSVAAIYQTFDGRELYPSVEEKAANLLYFIIKNHSLIDGNKRIAAAIFLWFLEGNGLLYREDGSKRLADNALVALTLMIAESKSADRDVITALVVNLINKKN